MAMTYLYPRLPRWISHQQHLAALTDWARRTLT